MMADLVARQGCGRGDESAASSSSWSDHEAHPHCPAHEAQSQHAQDKRALPSPSPSHHRHPCVECLHELLAHAKNLRPGDPLPEPLNRGITRQCSVVGRMLREQSQRKRKRMHRQVVLGEILCPAHASGMVNAVLGKDLLGKCLAWLESPRDVCNAALVCKTWREVIEAEDIWEDLLLRLPHTNFIPAHGSEPCESGMRRYRNYSRVHWDRDWKLAPSKRDGEASARAEHLHLHGGGGGDEEDSNGGGAGETELDLGSDLAMRLEFCGDGIVKALSGTGLFQFFPAAASDGIDHWSSAPSCSQERRMVRACPPLRSGKGQWTLRLKRVREGCVNAIGVAARAAVCPTTCLWMFNTDGGSSSPTPPTPAGDAWVTIKDWHGFGDVVTPSFWTIKYDTASDEIQLNCGMSQDTGCPLVVTKGLVEDLKEKTRKEWKDFPHDDLTFFSPERYDATLRFYLVVLLQDTWAEIVSCGNDGPAVACELPDPFADEQV